MGVVTCSSNTVNNFCAPSQASSSYGGMKGMTLFSQVVHAVGISDHAQRLPQSNVSLRSR